MQGPVTKRDEDSAQEADLEDPFATFTEWNSEEDRRAFASMSIEALVADLSNDALREAFDWGPDVGREIIDPDEPQTNG